MSLDGQCLDSECDEGAAVVVVTFPMPAGHVFDWHVHSDHQLAWAASGVLTVRSESEAWVLPTTRALWIPAGVRHETLSTGTTTMRTLYVKPELCPVNWSVCTPIAVGSLLAQLINYLEDATLDDTRRANAETVLVDLLEPVSMTHIDVKMPTETRASEIALRLSEHPSDNRTLAEWGQHVGASDRTLSRVFIAETGLPFGRWRTLLRMRVALASLAAGQPVGNVSRDVGYESSSAFVAAFRKETGVTPSAYFRSQNAVAS
jgi:AraC-like DNA-binding protein